MNASTADIAHSKIESCFCSGVDLIDLYQSFFYAYFRDSLEFRIVEIYQSIIKGRIGYDSEKQ